VSDSRHGHAGIIIGEVYRATDLIVAFIALSDKLV
jgi:hypothetical protein